jgi:hypothetical protein
MKPMPTRAINSRVLVARRYVEHGFLDAAIRLFVQNAAMVEAHDWQRLVERLLERGRIADAVHLCEVGGIPLPVERLLALGDHRLQRRDFDGAIHFYELAGADRDRWARVVDTLTSSTDQELRAIELAERHLVDAPDFAEEPVAVAS